MLHSEHNIKTSNELGTRDITRTPTIPSEACVVPKCFCIQPHLLAESTHSPAAMSLIKDRIIFFSCFIFSQYCCEGNMHPADELG